MVDPTVTAIVGTVAGWVLRPRATVALLRLAVTAKGQWGRDFLERLQAEKCTMEVEKRQLREIAKAPWSEVLAHEAVRRLQNRDAVLRLSASQASASGPELASGTPAPAPLDPDWWAAFWAGAENVTNDEMQGVWARILAGECATPGSFSLRTLALVRVLSRTDAAAFEKWAARAFVEPDGAGFIPRIGVSKGGSDFLEVTSLQDHGLLSSDFNAGLKSTGGVMGIHGQVALRGTHLHPTAQEALRLDVFPVFLLTKTGTELLRIADVGLDEAYLAPIVAEAKRSGWTLELIEKLSE